VLAEPGSRDSFEQFAGVGVEAVECFSLGFARDGEPAVPDQPRARHGDEVLQLGGGTAAQDDHVRQQRHELLERLEGLGAGPGRRRILDDLGQGTVKVGNQDYLAWLYASEGGPQPGVSDPIGFLNHPSTLQTRAVPLEHRFEFFFEFQCAERECLSPIVNQTRT